MGVRLPKPSPNLGRLAKTSQAYEVRVRYMDPTKLNPLLHAEYDIYEPVTGLMVPKMLLTDDEIIREIHLEARMLQRVHEYFQSQIKAGVKGIPNSRSLKAKELDLARRLQPVYDLDKFPDDPYPFDQDWVNKQGALTIVRKEFTAYATQMLAANPVKPMKSFIELTFGKEALKKEIDHFWLFGFKQRVYDVDSFKAYEELAKRCDETLWPFLKKNEPVEVIKPFVEYTKFEPSTPDQYTEEELAEMKRRSNETWGMDKPSDSDKTDTAAEEKDKIRQMYASCVEGCDEPFFDIERSTTKRQSNYPPTVKAQCPMGKLIDI
ncbi:hypothetical protein NW768_002526 [Fusarium equiseti]|uniref:Uncharacterized protein n=1 Tax=Fusarium equiseti TaxID=61235 RepID=A0ABQ8RNZ0_FUSEQ|nr:hypothetical protein NW768_002526 [Fusarium equiseti]